MHSSLKNTLPIWVTPKGCVFCSTLFRMHTFRESGCLATICQLVAHYIKDSKAFIAARGGSPLFSVLQVMVWMVGTDLAGRRPCLSSLPCSPLERCWRTLITASFSRSWAWRTRILNGKKHTILQLPQDKTNTKRATQSHIKSSTCFPFLDVCDSAKASPRWSCYLENAGVNGWWLLYLWKLSRRCK